MDSVSHIQGRGSLGELLAEGPTATAGAARLLHLLSTFTGDPDRLGAFVLDDGSKRLGMMPYLRQSYPLPCRVGEVRLFGAPLRRMRLLHEAGYWVDTPDAYRSLLEKIDEAATGRSDHGVARLGLDVVWAPAVPIGSGLAELPASRGLADGFRAYRPSPPVPRHQIRLPETFEAYVGGLTAKSRGTLRRKVRKLLGQPGLLDAGSLDGRATGLVRVTAPDDVPWLVERMADISHKTYQYNLLGLGVQDPGQLARDATAAAQRGWLRSYILLVDGRPLAFMHGLQFGGGPGDGTFDYLDVGHDPAWAAQSPGTVLQYLVIEDLYRHNKPAVFDFGPGDAVHKARFANTSRLETDLYLFRPTARALLAHGAHAACACASGLMGGLLGTLRIKSKVRRTMRKLACGP